MAVVEDLIEIREIEGRGRALVSTKPLKPGQIILKDSPLLLYSSLPLITQNLNNLYCSHCFRILNPNSSLIPLVSCLSCPTSLFCNPTCRSIALTTSHTPYSCQALTQLRLHPSPELHHHEHLQIQIRFLISAYNLALISPSGFLTLLSLQGSASQPDDTSVILHSLISSLCPPPVVGFSLELTSVLLAKDRINSFGLMEPFGEDRERSVRAYGIYPMASFFNHDCLPNACRFDYVDKEPVTELNNTDIIVRMIHDVDQGREICLSYFPVNLRYAERQMRLRDDYGFECDCDRCKVEANWSSSEEDDDVEEDLDKSRSDVDEEAAVMEEVVDENMAGLETENDGVDKEGDDFPHSYFFLRYMCDRKNCWGTLAPLPPSDGTSSSIMECNVCCNLKNCDEVMDG